MMTRAERRKIWEERVSSFKASGQTQVNWCDDQEINIHQLRYWIRKFQSEKLTEPSTQEWISVKVDNQMEESTSSRQSNIVVKVGEAEVEVKPGFDPLLLANVVKALSDNVQ